MRWIRAVSGVFGSGLLVASLAAFPVRAQETTSTTVAAKAGSKPPPTSFVVETTASAIQLDLSAPTLLPLDINIGIGYAGTNFNSQPLIKTNAAPLYLPLLASLGLLGGWVGVPDLVIGLLPSLVVGLPTLWGLPQLPLDQKKLAETVEPARPILKDLWPKKEPVLGCESFYPGDVAQAECGGRAEDVLGFQINASGARTTVVGDPMDKSKMHTEATASVLEVKTVKKPGLVPFSTEFAKSSTAAKVEDGIVKAGVSTSLGEISIGGILKIAALESSVSAELGGTKETAAVSERRCKIVGASIMGIPIEFGDSGFTLANADKVPGGVNTAVKIANEALSKAGIIIGKAGEASTPLPAAAPPAGGATSGFDPGILKITPYPGIETKMAEDGTSMETNFGCLEIHYRVPVSGLDVKLNLGRVSLKMGAFIDPEFGFKSDEPFTPSPTTPNNVGGTTNTSPIAQLVDLGTTPVGNVDPTVISDVVTSPTPSSDNFLRESPKVLAASWGITGGWFAPFGLLVLALPLLAYARRAAIIRR
ncbi:MAG: hypothetical protein ACSLFB_02690 [Acidimicrobiales bacterium]